MRPFPDVDGIVIGLYRVIDKLGEGGMARCIGLATPSSIAMWRSTVRPEAFTSDPDRLARFEREAKVLAALNQPNIAGIDGLAELDGVKATGLPWRQMA